jgi:hypothetical protein
MIDLCNYFLESETTISDKQWSKQADYAGRYMDTSREKVVQELRNPKAVSPEVFDFALKMFAEYDKNFQALLDRTWDEARKSSLLRKINQILRHDGNEFGVHWQISFSNNGYDATAQQHIGRDDLYHLMTHADIDPNNEIKDFSVNIEDPGVRQDIFMNSFEKNKRYLHYRLQ